MKILSKLLLPLAIITLVSACKLAPEKLVASYDTQAPLTGIILVLEEELKIHPGDDPSESKVNYTGLGKGLHEVKLFAKAEQESLAGFQMQVVDGPSFQINFPQKKLGSFFAKKQVLSPDQTGLDYVIEFGLVETSVPLAKTSEKAFSYCVLEGSNRFHNLEDGVTYAAAYAFELAFRDQHTGAHVAIFLSTDLIKNFDSAMKKEACAALKLYNSI